MAKLPTVPILSTANIADPQLKQVCEAMNQSLAAISSALDNGITVGDNLAAQVDRKQLYISDDGKSYPFGLTWRFPGVKPAGCIVVKAESQDGVERVGGALQPNWIYDSGRIVILAVRGPLELNFWYSFVFFTFGE